MLNYRKITKGSVKMKKILVALMSLVLIILAFAGCNNAGTAEITPEPTAVPTAEPTATRLWHRPRHR